MSQKQAKLTRRMVRKQKTRINKEFVRMIKGMNFLARLEIAWFILRGTK